jgi:hypothetical protein
MRSTERVRVVRHLRSIATLARRAAEVIEQYDRLGRPGASGLTDDEWLAETVANIEDVLGELGSR